MIIRKPYAFLIKNFKLIHLILTGLYIYLAIKVNNILTYYNNFIAGNESKLNAIKYMTNYYLIAITLSIIICLIIYALMRYKKKPKLLYLILIILYLIVALIINISYKGLDTIYISVLDTKTQRLYRDLLRIIIVFQYISIVFTLVRGLGFDIKKFNFKEDISELELDITDDEEIELTMGNTEGLQRKLRRQLRELKYYYKENKLFINIIIIVVILILASTITVDKQIINKTYNENEIITTDSFNINVLNTYITNKSYNNKTISNTDTSFLIARIAISTNEGAKKLNTSNLVLKIKNNNYTSTTRYYDNFVDIGYGYKEQKISNQKEYLFVFNISNEDLNKDMQLIYAGDKKINIKPINLDEQSKTEEYKLTETIDLSKTSLKNGNITINSIEIKNKFSYAYNYEINGKTYTSNLNIISLNNTIINLKLISQLPYNLTSYDFISNYGKVKYKINNEEYTSKVLNNKTPGNYTEGLYIEVDKNIESASSIWLELNVRNIKYIYTLK